MKKSIMAIPLVLLLCYSFGCQQEGEVSVKSSELIITRKKVDIGGFKLHIDIMGEGSPTVIFNPGLGDTMTSWFNILNQVSEFTRSASYDRAGLGQSEPSPLSRENINIAKELHTLLKNAGLQPPYVLVGHSLGGIHILTYADMFPNEIAGMVFIDPKDGTTFDGWKADLKPEKYDQLFNNFEDFYASQSDIVKAEWEVLKKSIGNPQKFNRLPNVPVVLLTSARLSEDESNFVTPEVVNSSIRVHKELLEQFDNSTHVITKESGHYISFDEPKLVVNAIRKIVDLVRSNNK